VQTSCTQKPVGKKNMPPFRIGTQLDFIDRPPNQAAQALPGIASTVQTNTGARRHDPFFARDSATTDGPP